VSEYLWRECPLCREYADEKGYAMVGAFASVGIEHGKSVTRMASEYFERYHASGHQEAR
jgi:hypothetical protein